VGVCDWAIREAEGDPINLEEVLDRIAEPEEVLRYLKQAALIIAQLQGGRSIVRAEKPRSVQWWRVGRHNRAMTYLRTALVEQFNK